MSGLSTYTANKVIDHVVGKTAFTMPTPTYVALFTTAPTDAGGGVEVSTGAYARVAITSSMTAASAGADQNSGAIVFPTPTLAWGTIQAVGIFDALTVGNLLLWNVLAVPRAVGSGDVVQFNTGKLIVQRG